MEQINCLVLFAFPKTFSYKSSPVLVLQIQSSPYFTNPVHVLQIQSMFHKSNPVFVLQYASFVELDTSIVCHVLVYCFGSFLLQDMFLSLQVFAFEGQNMAFTVNVLLTWFLPRATYLPSYVFLRGRRSITSRKLYVCIEKCLCFSCTIWSSLWLSLRSMLDVLVYSSFDRSDTTGFKWNSLRTSLLTVLRVVYAIVRLSLGKTCCICHC